MQKILLDNIRSKQRTAVNMLYEQWYKYNYIIIIFENDILQGQKCIGYYGTYKYLTRSDTTGTYKSLSTK